MNYIELIRCFWRSHEQHSFNATEIALYFHLLEICNICNWENPFKRNNAKIRADLGISYNTLQNARNKLQQKGVISFKTINGSPNVSYTLSKYDKVSDEVGAEVGAEVGMTKDKLNKTKQNEEIGIDSPSKNESYNLFNKWISEHCPYVAKIKHQMTEKEFETLKSNHSSADIQNVIESMDNRAGIAKNYMSVYRTANNWLKRNNNGNKTT